MSEAVDQLPVSLQQQPHWRVLMRPSEYKPQLIPRLADCKRLVEKDHVALRGWDFPHLGRDSSEIEYGESWIASWSNFGEIQEYWRLYQSAQFLHLRGVRERLKASWDAKLRKNAEQSFVGGPKPDWATVPGFLDIINTLYNVAEIYEFARRLSQVEGFGPTIEISIEVKNVKGFVLCVSDVMRVWYGYYTTNADAIRRQGTYKVVDLFSDQRRLVLEDVFGIFERFGWLEPPRATFEKDYDSFVKSIR